MSLTRNQLFQKAYLFPIAISLFLTPLIWNSFFVNAFVAGKILFLQAILLFTALLAIIALAKKRSIQLTNLFKSTLFSLLFLQLFLFLIANLFSPTPAVTFYGTFSRGTGFQLDLFLFFFLIYTATHLYFHAKTPKDQTINTALKTIFASGLLISFYGIFQYFNFDFFFQNFDTAVFDGRLFSFLGNPSYLGQYLSLTLLISLYFTYQQRSIFYLTSSFLFLLVIFLSGTRVAILALLCAAILYLLKHLLSPLLRSTPAPEPEPKPAPPPTPDSTQSKIKTKTKLFLAATCLLIVTTYNFLPAATLNRFSLSENATRSLHSRFEIWTGTLQLIKQKPILGYGQSTFSIYFPEILNKNLLSLEENINITADQIHNETLETLFSFGLAPLALYLLLSLYLLKTFFLSKQPLLTLTSLIILTNLIQNQFSFSDISIKLLIIFCYACVVFFELQSQKPAKIRHFFKHPQLLALFSLVLVIFFLIRTVIYPFKAHLAHAQEDLATALHYTPYYTELWHQFAPQNLPLAITALERLEPSSKQLLSLKAHLLENTDPDLAKKLHLQALSANPQNPNWLKAYADMLFRLATNPSQPIDTETLKEALKAYYLYLQAIPDFYQWGENFQSLTPAEQRKYTIFTANAPEFQEVISNIRFILKHFSS